MDAARSIRTLVVLLAVFCIAATASATPVTWSITGAFDDGGTISGSYVFDADTDLYSSIAVTTTNGTTRSGANYLFHNPCCSSQADFLLFVTTNVGSLTGTPVLSADLTNVMTNAGGVIPLAIAGSGRPFFSEESCNDASCNGPTGDTRRLVSGSVTSIAAVPEPATLTLIAAPIYLMARRRRAQQTSRCVK